jgi:hypothetical protein
VKVEVLAEGVLQKHSPNKAFVSRWQTRHFVLTPLTLAYYKKQNGAYPSPCPSLSTLVLRGHG